MTTVYSDPETLPTLPSMYTTKNIYREMKTDKYLNTII